MSKAVLDSQIRKPDDAQIRAGPETGIGKRSRDLKIVTTTKGPLHLRKDAARYLARLLMEKPSPPPPAN
jgi:hypothetical protein